MSSNYVLIQTEDRSVTVKRYLNEKGVPCIGQPIFHDTIPLGTITEVVGSEHSDNWVLTPDQTLPYMLIGTVLTIGAD